MGDHPHAYCKRGHPLWDGKNVFTHKNGSRCCRICLYARTRAWQAANREKLLAQHRAYKRRKRAEARALKALFTTAVGGNHEKVR